MDDCELTLHANKPRKSSVSAANSRRSSKASVASDQDAVSRKRSESTGSLGIFDSSILNIEPLDLRKLEMMSEVQSDDDEPYDEESDDPENAVNPEEDNNSLKDLNNNDYYTEQEMEDVDILKEIDENKIIELKELQSTMEKLQLFQESIRRIGNNAFELFDINGDGLITHTDLKKTYISLGLDVSDEEITKMLDDGSKPLDEEGFIKMVGARTIHLDPDYIMCEALSKWDRDDSGLIPLAKIRADLMAAGDRFTEREVEVALEETPIVVVKGRKMIDYKEFSQSLCCIRKRKLHEE